MIPKLRSWRVFLSSRRRRGDVVVFGESDEDNGDDLPFPATNDSIGLNAMADAEKVTRHLTILVWIVMVWISVG